MERKFYNGQLVWAKIKTYPWWPAIVGKVEQINLAETDEEPEYQDEITVNFIGENTHAALDTKEVMDYEENYKQYSNVKQKKLKNCILIADKFLSKELDISDLVEINSHLSDYVEKFIPKSDESEPSSSQSESESEDEPEPKKIQKIDEPENNGKNRLKEVSKQLESKISLSGKAAENSRKREFDNISAKINDLRKGLCTYLNDDEETKEPLCPINDICDYLSYLIQNTPDSSLLESSKILKAFKLFKSDHISSPNQNLRSLSDICYKLYLFWKRHIINESIKSLIASPVKASSAKASPAKSSPTKASSKPKSQEKKYTPKKAPAKKNSKKSPKKVEKEEAKQTHKPSSIGTTDFELRKKVCRKIAKIIEDRGIPKNQSQDHALELEKIIRAKDPHMKEKYVEAFKELRKKLTNEGRDISDIIKECERDL
ncbi:unnamed protein product [Blepharisma stoltei]|uniref:PWWP domain-containing protein n=1 Tax=Blepharisma stoltei TaxID=1481888 RepID=A0AAU9J1W1_9CILI|nr:unnamed protein product [Blepharisma stoltei]